MKNVNFLLLLVAAFCLTFTACKKEDLFTGNVNVTSGGQDPAGDFTGNGDSGPYTFTFNNPETRVEASFDITSVSGSSVQMLVMDSENTTVLDKTLTAGSGPDSFSGLSSQGVAGEWTVTLVFVGFDGDGSYSISPA